MPVDASAVGATFGERRLTLTVRQCLAYAAGTGDLNARHLDDARPDGIVAPPMLGVTLDWPLRDDLLHALRLSGAEAVRGIHATQDMTFHRMLRPGDELLTRGTVVAVERRPPGAYVLARYETAVNGWPGLTTYYGMIFRGVDVAGDRGACGGPPLLPKPVSAVRPRWQATVPVARTAPHAYSECARIYNPIHTERAVALAAGLPDIIVHGTLTLAYAVREIVARECNGDPSRLRRVACRFAGMVIPGGAVAVQLDGDSEHDGGRALSFAVLTAEGATAIRDGVALVSAA